VKTISQPVCRRGTFSAGTWLELQQVGHI